jgi:pimeloyl-ACP methyl ester carboxylesterase
MHKKLIQAGFEEKRFDTGELKLNYVVGPNNGPALLLIPAQTGIWESYEKVMLPLAQKFQVYVVEIRGHGKSDWATGDYSWASIGRDMRAFAEQVIKRPAIVSGNSSGGVISLWMAANIPERVSALILEDAPVFSVEMPRFKEQDRYVYEGLVRAANALSEKPRQLGNYFRGQELPLNEGRRVKRMPDGFVRWLSGVTGKFEAAHPGEPVDIKWFPASLRVLIKSISTFDPDFAQAFVDGRMYAGLNHAEALKKVKCPVLLIHANWFRHEKWGLVGAMDDKDAERIQKLAPQMEYVKVTANHVVHFFEAKKFVELVEGFVEKNKLLA